FVSEEEKQKYADFYMHRQALIEYRSIIFMPNISEEQKLQYNLEFTLNRLIRAQTLHNNNIKNTIGDIVDDNNNNNNNQTQKDKTPKSSTSNNSKNNKNKDNSSIN